VVVAKISKVSPYGQVKLVEESDPVLFPSRDDTLLNPIYIHPPGSRVL